MKALLLTLLLTLVGLASLALTVYDPVNIDDHLINAADEPQPLAGECGDLNGDNAKNILDVVSTMKLISGATPGDLTRERVADVNLSGAADLGDGELIIDHIFGLKPALDECGLVIEVKNVVGSVGQIGVFVDVVLHHSTFDIQGFTIDATPQDPSIVDIAGVDFPIFDVDPICLTLVQPQGESATKRIVVGDICERLGADPSPQTIFRLNLSLLAAGSTKIDLMLQRMDEADGRDLVPATQRFVLPGTITVNAAAPP